MPPHCDSLPFVHLEGEDEVRSVFDQTLKARELGPEARDLADRWFFETVVRVHRAGEGAPYTGLKPSGLDVGPVIRAAERSLSNGAPAELIEVMCSQLRLEVERRHAEAMMLKRSAHEGLVQMRSYVEAMLGLQVWAHSVDRQVRATPHAHPDAQRRGESRG